MKIHDVTQGTREWLALRAGIPTASSFDKIVTPGGKLSKSADSYRNRLLAEWMAGHPLDQGAQTWAMERGNLYESEAADAYEFQTGNITQVVGFCTSDDGAFGYSPDRFVGDDGLLEIKVNGPAVHVGYMLDPAQLAADYRLQVQGGMMVTERRWCDLVSYCKELGTTVIYREERDEDFITLLITALAKFNDQMETDRQKIDTKFGPFVRVQSDPESNPFGITEADAQNLADQLWSAAEARRMTL